MSRPALLVCSLALAASSVSSFPVIAQEKAPPPASPATSAPSPATSPVASTPPEGFRTLFNTRDLSGWHGLNPHSVAKLSGEKKEAALKQMREDFANHWRVENGELVNNGTGPYATTDEEFGDYELMLEYKTVAKADSGIYLRGVPQVQIWDSNQVFDPTKPDRRLIWAQAASLTTRPRRSGVIPSSLKTNPSASGTPFASSTSVTAFG